MVCVKYTTFFACKLILLLWVCFIAVYFLLNKCWRKVTPTQHHNIHRITHWPEFWIWTKIGNPWVKKSVGKVSPSIYLSCGKCLRSLFLVEEAFLLNILEKIQFWSLSIFLCFLETLTIYISIFLFSIFYFPVFMILSYHINTPNFIQNNMFKYRP